jgi:hypothetical protein
MEDPADLRMRLEGSGYSLDLVRIEEIVGIQHADDIARAGRESGIERRSLTAIGLENRANAVAVAGDNLPRIVGRSVVDDHDLGVGIGLVQGALDGVARKRP